MHLKVVGVWIIFKIMRSNEITKGMRAEGQRKGEGMNPVAFQPYQLNERS